jgi:phospholipid/cholesterol/gamma-HCH transport system substrate-binding protein
MVGMFVILAILLFIITIYLIGKKEYVFGSPVKISAVFKDVKGLREGDKVRLSGIDIGTVSSTSFMADNRVLVQMNIDQEHVKFMKNDSRITIASEGLMGSKVVLILPGSLEAEPVSEFDTLVTIEQVDIDDILREVNRSSQNISVVSEELVSITKKINRGDGIFGKIFTDTTLTDNLDDAVRNINYITENLSDLSKKVNQGQGIVGKLFADTTLTRDLGSAGTNIDQIAINIKEITEKINQGEGVFGRMFTDTSMTSNLFLASKNLQATTGELAILTERLNNDSSALSLFIDDPSFADSLDVLIDRLNIGIEEATEAADAIQRSGLIRLFSKKKKEGESAKGKEQRAKNALED